MKNFSLNLFLLFIFSGFCFGQIECIHLEDDINVGDADSNPGSLIEFDGTLCFLASTEETGREFAVFDGTETTIYDIFPGSEGSSAYGFIELDGKLYFSAKDGVHGTELWYFDGTEVGLAADVNEGAISSNVGWKCVYNDALYFFAFTSTYGSEVWKYDGTEASLAIEINPGTGSSLPQELFVYNDLLYFVARNDDHGFELWEYDGTDVTMIDIRPGTESSLPRYLLEFDDELYFQADDGTDGVELWKFDGTTASQVEDIYPGVEGSNPRHFLNTGDKLYFIADDAAHGAEVREYDGTTLEVIDIEAGAATSAPSSLVAFGDGICLRATDPTYGNELHYYDGTDITVYDLEPGAEGSFLSVPVLFGERLYFSAITTAYGAEIYKFDGSTVGLVEDVLPEEGISGPTGFTEFNDALYFNISSPSGRELHAMTLFEEAAIEAESGTLTCTSVAETYQWLNCDGMTVIDGETDAEFTPTEDGDYAVVVYSGECTDTSDCFTIAGAGLDEETAFSVNAYPNPGQGIFTITLNEHQEKIMIRVSDISGRLIMTYPLPNTNQFELEIPGEPGVYILTIVTSGGSSNSIRLIKSE